VPRFLSDSDVTKLRRLIADVGTLRGQIRTLHDRAKGGERSGAHYIMLTPSGGIPAAAGSPLVPGEADCLIQWAAGSTREVTDTARPEKVYNLSTSAIGGGELLIAHRDNWGDLWVELGGGETPCEELSLSVGSYRGICGATIAPGETGPIQVNGGEECAAVIVDAVNHSECTFYLGERITAHVDKCCTAWFTGCSCCGSETPPPCCDRSVAICIAGELKLVAVNGGSASWDVSACCDCEGATIEVEIACEPGSGQGEGQGPGPGGNTTITATWTYTCGETVVSDDIDLSSLCDDEADVEILGELAELCDGNLNDRWANYIAECDPCEPEPPPPCDCCFELLPWTTDECDKSDVPDFVDDVGLTAVSVSRDPWCNGLSNVLTLTFTNNSGGDYGGGGDPIQIILSGNTPNAVATATAASDSGTITNTPGTGGFTVEWPMPGTWANGTTITRTVTMTGTCTPGVGQLSALVAAGRGYECSIVWDAIECP
jgi:hypothetical protein